MAKAFNGSKKNRLKEAIDKLKSISDNDSFISDIVEELQEHADTLEDDSEEGEGNGGNHPGGPGGKP